MDARWIEPRSAYPRGVVQTPRKVAFGSSDLVRRVVPRSHSGLVERAEPYESLSYGAIAVRRRAGVWRSSASSVCAVPTMPCCSRTCSPTRRTRSFRSSTRRRSRTGLPTAARRSWSRTKSVYEQRVAARRRRRRQGRRRHRLRAVRPHEPRHDRLPREDRQDARHRRRAPAHDLRTDAGAVRARPHRVARSVALLDDAAADDGIGRDPNQARDAALAARGPRDHAARRGRRRRAQARERHDRRPKRDDLASVGARRQRASATRRARSSSRKSSSSPRSATSPICSSRCKVCSTRRSARTARPCASRRQMNFDANSTETKSYAPQGTVRSQQTERESYTGTGRRARRARGVPGTTTNVVPTYQGTQSQQATAATPSRRRRRTTRSPSETPSTSMRPAR